MEARDLVLDGLARRRSGFSLPREFYVSPEIFRLDLETVFHREWLFVGHASEIEKVGSYLTYQVGEYSVIVVRDADRSIKAFHNSCRHRGSRICTAEKGVTAKLVCPYHQWTYDLDGRLLWARDMGPDFDAAAYGLKPVHCETMAGYVFVCVCPMAPSFEPVRATIERFVAAHGIAEAKVAHETAIVERGNWKLVWENNRECYHCAGTHPELCRSFPDTPFHALPEHMAEDPDFRRMAERCATLDLPIGFEIAEDAQYRVTRLALMGKADSYTMDGRPAVRRPLRDGTGGGGLGAVLFYHYPTTWNHILGDHAVTFRVTPVGPQETLVTTKWLVHRDAREGIDYDVERLAHVWTATNDQDRRIVEENQRGVNSPAYEPGPYAPVQEAGVIQFVDWYAGLMERRLAGGTELEKVA